MRCLLAAGRHRCVFLCVCVCVCVCVCLSVSVCVCVCVSVILPNLRRPCAHSPLHANRVPRYRDSRLRRWRLRQAVPPGLRAVAADPARGEHLRSAFARECALLAPYAGIALALVPLPVISPCKADMSLSGSRTLSTLSSGSRASSSLFSRGIHPSLCHRTQRDGQTYRQSE